MLYLASISPRRRDLLERAGIEHRRITPGSEPELDAAALSAEAEALQKARAKAMGADASVLEGLVLGADTVVRIGTSSLGQPKDREQARGMLELLSGRVHRVVTGVVLERRPDRVTFEEAVGAEVRFERLTQRDVEDYLDTEEWRGKAGGYAVQGLGRRLVAAVDGPLDTVIGLPVAAVRRLLELAAGGAP